MDFFPALLHMPGGIPGIHDAPRLCHNPIIIIGAVIGRDHHTVRPVEHTLAQRRCMESRHVLCSNEGVVEAYLTPLGLQEVQHIEGWRLP
jgi:hypothetical protein